MKLITTLLLTLLLTTNAFASYIQCFSHESLIYAGKVYKIASHGNFLLFTEKKSHKIIAVYADCIIRV